MPVHRQKKDTTPHCLTQRRSRPAPALPDQQTFQQYLRELARSAIRVVLEGVMREELDALIGVGWGECSPKRKGYRNGSYTPRSGHLLGSDRGHQGAPRSRRPVPHPGLRALPPL